MSTEPPVGIESPALSPSGHVAELSAPERGASVGRYVLLKRLGAGGMGVVFAAWDPELDRRVAIKLISDRNPALHRQLRARLRREAQAMGRLRHPNVVNVYDVGESDGRLFIAMEHVDGVSLRQWLHATARTSLEIVAVFRQAGEGLAAAHAQGVIHRDFKPDNVLVANDGRVLVLDFGLASWAWSPNSGMDPIGTEPHGFDATGPRSPPLGESGEPADAGVHNSTWESSGGPSKELVETKFGNLTAPGTVLGTPAYMAPEQHLGLPTNTHSDQFSFCAALWEALNGELPFGSGSLIVARAKTGQFGPFERRDAPANFERVLRRGLAWNPAERWPDMRALLDALNPPARTRRWAVLIAPAIVLGLGVAAAQLSREQSGANPDVNLCDGGLERTSKIWSEDQADALALAFSERGRNAEQTWQYMRAELDRWTASWIAVDSDLCLRYGRLAGIQDGVRQEQLACLDRQLGHLEQLIEVLATVSEAEVPKSFDLLATLPNPERCRDVGSEPEREPEHNEFDPSQLAELELAIARGELELELSRLDRVEQNTAELFEQTNVRGLEPQHLRAAKLRLDLLVAKRRPQVAIDVAFSGLEAAERSGDPLLRLEALLLVADALVSASNTIAAELWLRQARMLAGELMLDRGARVRLAVTEARVATNDARFGEALAAWDRALAAMVPEQDRFDYIVGLHNRATILFLDNRPAEGLEQLRRCEQMWESLVGKNHGKVLQLRMDIAHAQERLGEHAISRALYLAVAADLETAHDGPTDLSIAARSHAAALLAMLGDCEAARAEFERLMGPARELMAYPSAVLGNLLRRRAALCDYLTPDAVDYATQAVALYREALTDEHVSTAATHAELGIALLVAGDPAKAKLAASRALELFAIVDPEGKDSAASPKRHAARAVQMLARHALAEAGALDGADALLAELPEDPILHRDSLLHRRLSDALAQARP